MVSRSRTSTEPPAPHLMLMWPNWVGVAVSGGPERPFEFSGIFLFTCLHDDLSIRTLFFRAPKPICDGVVVVPFFVTLFATVVSANTPGCRWPLIGGRVTPP